MTGSCWQAESGWNRRSSGATELGDAVALLTSCCAAPEKGLKFENTAYPLRLPSLRKGSGEPGTGFAEPALSAVEGCWAILLPSRYAGLDCWNLKLARPLSAFRRDAGSRKSEMPLELEWQVGSGGKKE
jgi:hypothetical protein